MLRIFVAPVLCKELGSGFYAFFPPCFPQSGAFVLSRSSILSTLSRNIFDMGTEMDKHFYKPTLRHPRDCLSRRLTKGEKVSRTYTTVTVGQSQLPHSNLGLSGKSNSFQNTPFPRRGLLTE